MPNDRLPRVVIGLAIALAFAVLGAHPKVRALERRLGVTVLISAGVPFLAMGAIFRLPSVDILTPDILTDLKPAFEFGLGWIGFVVGIQFDVRTLDRLPAALGPVIAIETIVPMVTTAALCSLAFLNLGATFTNVNFARDALVLAACAAASAPISAQVWAPRIGSRSTRLIEDITRVDEVVALAMLGAIAIFFRPPSEFTLWRLPSSAWLLVTLGLGGVLGIITYALIRGAKTAAEKLALLLGAIALSAGMAGYLALSVPVVCAIAGALLTNLPLRNKGELKQTLGAVERPLYLIFLVVVGASWRPDEWQGWVIAPAFALARVAGKRLGAIWAKRSSGAADLPSAHDLALALAPQSPIAVVAIVSASTLYHGVHEERVRWAINAVIIGGVLTEVVVRVLERRAYHVSAAVRTPMISVPGVLETSADEPVEASGAPDEDRSAHEHDVLPSEPEERTS